VEIVSLSSTERRSIATGNRNIIGAVIDCGWVSSICRVGTIDRDKEDPLQAEDTARIINDKMVGNKDLVIFYGGKLRLQT
jgi:hypothetical protein